MLHLVRAAGGITGGVAGALSGVLAVVIAFVNPQDPTARAYFLAAAITIGTLAIIGILTFAIADIIRDHKRDALDKKRDKRERKRDRRERERDARERASDESLKKFYDTFAASPTPFEPAFRAAPTVRETTPPEAPLPTVAPEATPPQPAPPRQMLRTAALDLASEIRTLVNSVPDGLTLEGEFEHLFEVFLKTYWPRLRDIKDRLDNVLPKWSVASSTKWLPNSKDNVQCIADDLEKDALKTPPDIPL